MSLFKRPTWSQPAGPTPPRDGGSGSLPDDDAGINDRDESKNGARSLFSHSEKFMSIMHDSERQRQRREAREKEKRQQKQTEGLDKSKAKGRERSKEFDSGSGSDYEEERRSSSSSKRRRISARDGAALLESIGMDSPLQSRWSKQASLDEDDEEEGERKYKSVRMRSSESPRRGMAGSPPKMATRSQPAVALDDSDDEIEYLGAASRSEPQKEAQHDDHDDEDESDPELLELKRKARARLAEQNQNPPPTGLQTTTSTTTDTSIPTSFKSPVTLPDAPVKILITSPIPNTNPLIIYRKLSQRLQEVREVWCVKQGFSEEFARSVFLTYRQRRLFNVTTCRSLGLEADEHGNVTRMDDRTKEGVDQVHLEAVTPELFEQVKAERARQARNEADREDENTAEGEREAVQEEQADETQKQTQQNIKIVVKAKGKPEFKLLVKADTQIARIIKAARKNFGIPDEQDTRLEFDGDELDPQDQVQNTEIEDMVCLDLHVAS